jgi:signal-transduction protein with cAMP-binding, CBS, and nucleotidyltransferase domain
VDVARPPHDRRGESAGDCEGAGQGEGAGEGEGTAFGEDEPPPLTYALRVDRRSELIEALARLSLFADLSQPELEAVAHAADEEVFGEGQRIVREGLSGAGLYVVLEGEVVVRLADRELARLGRGEFFGEISVLLGTPSMADVVAETLVRCLVVPRPDVEPFLLERPRILYRMLQAEARRLRAAEL